MALSEKHSRESLIPSFLYSSSSSTKTLALEKMLHARPSGFTSNVNAEGASARKGLVIPSPSEPSKKIEMYSPSFYAACTVGGILSCGLTHTAVTPLDLVKCNMQVLFSSDPLPFHLQVSISDFISIWYPYHTTTHSTWLDLWSFIFVFARNISFFYVFIHIFCLSSLSA